MRGLVYNGKKNIQFRQDVEEPTIKHPLDVKIKVEWCGICGSDLHEYLEGPLTFTPDSLGQCMGHEYSGYIVEVGQDVGNLKVGDKVACETTGTCLDNYRYPERQLTEKCQACVEERPNICENLGFNGLGVDHGALSEFTVIGSKHVIKVPDFLPTDLAALIEPLAVAWHAMDISGIQAGCDALVFGGGPIGLVTIIALQVRGAGNIVCSEPAEARRKLAEELGAITFNPMDHPQDTVNRLKMLSNTGKGFSHTYDASGIPITFTQSLRCLGPGGIATNIAIWGHHPIDFYPMDVTAQERRVTGSSAYTIHDFRNVVSAFEEKKIDLISLRKLITAKVKLEDSFEKGIMELIENKERHIKILVTPNEN